MTLEIDEEKEHVPILMSFLTSLENCRNKSNHLQGKKEHLDL
jgi:hypothetical protein